MKRFFLAAFLLVCACKRSGGTDSAATDAMASAPAEMQASGGAGSPQATDALARMAPGAKGTGAAAPAQTTRMIVRNASMSVVVRDAADVLRKVTALVDGKGGYVSESRQWKEGEQVRGSATVRVPAAELSNVMTAIRGLAIRIENEKVDAQDVSEEFSDLGAQLRNLQAAEAELRELLTTIRQRTQKASEVMEVYAEISRTRSEIDRIQGRMQFLSQQTAFSTVTIELVPDVLAKPVVEPGWQPAVTVRNAIRALVNALHAVADILIWTLLYLLPLGLVFVAIALLLRPVWRRLRGTGKAPAQS